MRFLMFSYACIYLLILFSNIYYWIKYKGSLAMLLYELLSGAYMVFLIFVYFSPDIKEQISVPAVLPVIGVIMFDFYMSIWGDIRKFTPKSLPVEDKELEFARILSVIFAAPAYIVCLLLLIDSCTK
ncbi:MAG: hypothetical protein WCV67_17785 [Victivallaceae bacterium]|jgi:hypothetical protein